MKMLNKLTIMLIMVTVGYGLSLCMAYDVQEKQEDTTLVSATEKILLSGEKEGLEAVKRLIEQGTAVNQEYQLETPLSVAVRRELVSIVQYLIVHGAQITPDIINIAAVKGDLEMLKLLVEGGGNVNGIDHDGTTPLIRILTELYAQPYYEIVEYLVSMGADINKTVSRGITPLVAALVGGYEKIAKFFIEKGAAITARLELPINYPEKLDHSPEEALVNDASLLHLATISFLVEVAGLLIKKGVKPTANKYSMTPLHALALHFPGGPQSRAREKMNDSDRAQRGAKIIDLLLKNGVDINAQDAWGFTALMRAAAWSPELVLALLAAGANPCLVGNKGETALSLARDYQKGGQGWQEAINVLEEAVKKAAKK